MLSGWSHPARDGRLPDRRCRVAPGSRASCSRRWSGSGCPSCGDRPGRGFAARRTVTTARGRRVRPVLWWAEPAREPPS